MEAALLNVWVLFQKNGVVTDVIGNHKNAWEDYYKCHATVSGEGGREKDAVGLVIDDVDIAFTVRWCKKTSSINATGFRIIFDGDIYNITSIDHMNYKKKCIKFRCKKVRGKDGKDIN